MPPRHEPSKGVCPPAVHRRGDRQPASRDSPRGVAILQAERRDEWASLWRPYKIIHRAVPLLTVPSNTASRVPGVSVFPGLWCLPGLRRGVAPPAAAAMGGALYRRDPAEPHTLGAAYAAPGLVAVGPEPVQLGPLLPESQSISFSISAPARSACTSDISRAPPVSSRPVFPVVQGGRSVSEVIGQIQLPCISVSAEPVPVILDHPQDVVGASDNAWQGA